MRKPSPQQLPLAPWVQDKAFPSVPALPSTATGTGEGPALCSWIQLLSWHGQPWLAAQLQSAAKILQQGPGLGRRVAQQLQPELCPCGGNRADELGV